MDISLPEDAALNCIVGVDEAGRGPLAGDVVAAAVLLPPDAQLYGLDDSKKLSEASRERLYEEIRSVAIKWHIGRANVEEIDRLNILHATMLAMQRAVEGLRSDPEMVYVDGNRLPEWSYNSKAVVKGDSRITAIAAASILAKVTRDRDMLALDNDYPEYGFMKHKGYPTKVHMEALERHGASPVHRKSFGPVARVLGRF
jgi:ribonuclease HII